jgi:hypothetical protein
MGPETVALTASQLDPVSDAPSDETMRRMGFRRHDQGGRNGSNNSKSTHRAPRDAGDGSAHARLIEPWTFPENRKHLAKLEAAFFDALAAVDEVEDHKATGTFTPEGILADTLQFAAAKLAPKLKRARQTVERAREGVAAK